MQPSRSAKINSAAELPVPPRLRVLQKRTEDNRFCSSMMSSNFDILLSDINVSEDGDGFTVVRAMRDANPDCVTNLLTGYPGFETALEAIHNEVDDYVVKPADIAL